MRSRGSLGIIYGSNVAASVLELIFWNVAKLFGINSNAIGYIVSRYGAMKDIDFTLIFEELLAGEEEV